MEPWTDLDGEQARLLVDTRQLWQAWKDGQARRRRFAGSLAWQVSKGREYLVKWVKDPATGTRKAKGMGPRSAETEAVMEGWTTGKAAAKERLVSLNARMSRQARMNQAVGIARVPAVAARILRLLDRERLLGGAVTVAGTNALYAYEAAAAVMFGREYLATGDLDLLFDARAKLKLSIDGIEPPRVIDLLVAADPTFAPVDGAGYKAVNARGYFVDLIKPQPSPPWKAERERIAAGDLTASPIPNLKWLANAPKFETVAIGSDGRPVPMSCPDPRAFALFKLWLAKAAPDRDPAKRGRDRAQAEAVARLVIDRLPHLPFRPEHLTCFPRAVVDMASGDEDPFFEI